MTLEQLILNELENCVETSIWEAPDGDLREDIDWDLTARNLIERIRAAGLLNSESAKLRELAGYVGLEAESGYTLALTLPDCNGEAWHIRNHWREKALPVCLGDAEWAENRAPTGYLERYMPAGVAMTAAEAVDAALAHFRKMETSRES